MLSSNTQSDTIIATVYGKNQCPNCTNAKMFLKKNSIAFDYVSVEEDAPRAEFIARATKELGKPLMSVPQIWVGSKYVGGYYELVKFINQTKKSLIDSTSEGILQGA